MRRSPSTASWSRSSPRARRSRSSSKARARSPSSARRWARRTRPTPGPGRSAATSRSRCPTTSCTAPTRPSPPGARSPSGSVTEPDYVAVNRDSWTQANAEYTDRQARGAWAQEQVTYGKWSLPESELRVLPDVKGKDVVELGCGTAYFGAWLKRAGAKRVVGVDGKVDERLRRSQKGLYKLEWYDEDPGVEFHPPTSEMFRILRESGFELLDFRELFAPEDAADHEYYDTVPAGWAKRWPDEEIWRLRLHRR